MCVLPGEMVVIFGENMNKFPGNVIGKPIKEQQFYYKEIVLCIFAIFQGDFPVKIVIFFLKTVRFSKMTFLDSFH